MISQRTIDDIKQHINIVEVIGDLHPLKKKGANYMACCPFHNEKSASFSVSPAKGIYSCFGCGKTGDAISFLIEYGKFEYPEALEYLAEKYNLPVEYENDGRTPIERQQEKDKVAEAYKLVETAALRYERELLAKDDTDAQKYPDVLEYLLKERLLKPGELKQWHIGYAPGGTFIAAPMAQTGKHLQGQELGLVMADKYVQPNEPPRWIDRYRNRIIFPIQDHRGRFVGLAGRLAPGNKSENKYTNSPESYLYHKSNLLYGLHQALEAKAFDAHKRAILVEGYTDVISLHRKGFQNTVATCGTALTKEQCLLLKKFTDTVQLMRDGDKAGKDAAWKDTNLLLQHGFKVLLSLLPDGQDPDTFSQGIRFKKWMQEKLNQQDAVAYYVKTFFDGKTDELDVAQAIQQATELLLLVPDATLRNVYIDSFTKQFKLGKKLKSAIDAAIRKTEAQAKVIELKVEEPLPKAAYLPKTAYSEKYDPAHDMDEYGFYEEDNCYWSLVAVGKSKWEEEAFSNFTMRVLFHMSNGSIPRRVVELRNNRGRVKVVDITVEKMASKGKFKEFCEGLGNFRFWGSEGKLDKVKAKLFEMEAECREIEVLGWMDDGFWAWSNGIYNKEYIPLDENGFAQINNRHYYLPSGNTNTPNRTKVFANEIRFRSFPDSQVDFTTWAKKYYQVYGELGMAVQLFAIAAIFSDIVYNARGFFPLLFIYGEGGSGKSSAIKSAQRLFGIGQDPLTLSGKANTDKAKIAIFAQFRNALLLLEEYTNVHDTDQLLKNLYDRYGYKRRVMDASYRTESVPIQSAVAAVGNYAPSDDPTLQRLLYFENSKNEFTPEEKQAFNEFKNWEAQGVTNVTHQLLFHRQFVEEHYNSRHKEISKVVSTYFASEQVTDRMVENVTVLCTIYDIFSDLNFTFPYSKTQLHTFLTKSTLKQNEKRSSGNDAQRFWDIFLYLVNNGTIKHGKEFKIDGNELSIFFKQVHGLYMEAHRKLYSNIGLTSSLLDKLKIHPSYKGPKDSIRIGDVKTSGHVFYLDKTGIDLLQVVEYQHQQEMLRRNGYKATETAPEADRPTELPFG